MLKVIVNELFFRDLRSIDARHTAIRALRSVVLGYSTSLCMDALNARDCPSATSFARFAPMSTETGWLNSLKITSGRNGTACCSYSFNESYSRLALSEQDPQSCPL